jgi:predicted RNase H-like HicB family nuclease
MATFYIAGIVPEQEGGYSVYFPDVPNVAAGGRTVEEAITNAADGLYLAMKDIAERKAAVPIPSSLAETQKRVRAERELDGLPYPEETLYQYIEAPDTDTTPIRVSISLPKNALAALDRKAKSAGMTRSGYIARMALA